MKRSIPFLALLLCSCSDPGDADLPESEGTTAMKTLSGSVLYRERIALPPGATVSVTLEDSSRMDVAATVIAQSTVPANGAPPYPFELEYDPAKITEKGRYGLRAKIEADGQLLFTTDQFLPAFDESRTGPVEILVRSSGGAGSRPQPGKPVASLSGTEWTVREIDGVAATPGAGDKDLQIAFSDEGVSGFAGCNSFTGSFDTSGDSLTLGPLAATQRACIDNDVSAQEIKFLAALAEVDTYAIEGDTLLLKDESDQTIVLCEAPNRQSPNGSSTKVE